MVSSIVKTKSIVLGRIDFGNTSRIYTFLTPEKGKLQALYKGARRVKGRPGLGGGLDLLSENEILIYERRNGLAILAEWSEITSAYLLGQDAVRFPAAEVCAEYLRAAAVENHGEDELYRMLTDAVYWVGRCDRLVPLSLWVALAALCSAGFRPAVESCAQCGKEVGGAGPGVVLSGETGGLVCPACRGSREVEKSAPGLEAEGIALLRALLRMEISAAARLRPSRRAEEHLLRAVEHFASWRFERKMMSLSCLSSIIASLESVGCR